MMELQKASFSAPAASAKKCASASITRPHHASDSRRNITRRSSKLRRWPRALRRSEFFLAHVLQQQRECFRENLRRITVRNRVPQKILHAAQLVVRFPVHRKLNLVTLGRQRFHLRAALWRRQFSTRG